MERLEGWVKALTDHLSRQWLVHLAGGVGVMAGMMFLGLGVLVLYLLIFGGTMIFAALEMETMALVAFFGLAALGSLCVAVVHVVAFGFWLAWLRIATLRERGEAADWHELTWPLRHPVRVMGLGLLFVFLFFASAGLFYLPLVFVGPWLLLSAVSLAADDVGLFVALSRGWGRSGRVYGPLLLVSLVCTALMMAVYFLPLLGPALASALVVSSAVAIHESLAREEAPGR